MRHLKTVSLACVLALAATSICNAKTIQVHSGGSIQTGVNKARPGDKVQVDAGTFAGNITVSTPNIEIAGSTGTIVNGGTIAPGSFGFLIGESGVTLRGFTIRNFETGITDIAGGVAILSNTVTSCGTGIFLSTFISEETPAAACSVSSNIVTGNGEGIVIDFCQNVSASLNYVSGNSDNGIRLSNGTVTSALLLNIVNQNGGDGIFVDFSCVNNVIMLNSAHQNGIYDAEDEAGAFGFPLQNLWILNSFGKTNGL